MNRIEELENLIKHHNDLYWNNKELEISDIEYDNLIRELTELDPENELITSFGQESTEKLIKHSSTMLSLDKIYSMEEVLNWIKKFARNNDEEFLIQPKYDGMSGLLENGTLSSRGTGEYGQDYTEKLKMIKIDSPRTIDFKKDTMLGEIIIRNSDFKNIYSHIQSKSGNPFKNQRNGIAGILGTDDTDFYANQGAVITFVDYESFSIILKASEFKDKWEETVEKIQNIDYPLDGIVIKLADKEYAKSLGATAHHPRGSVAYKFTNQKKESKLIGVEWSMGKQQIAAVGLINPVDISGITISRVKLQLTKPQATDVDTYLMNGSLQIGDTVIVERAGDVIPHIISSKPGSERTLVKLNKCPFCGGELDIKETSVSCKNPDCKEKKIQNLYASIVTLGFKGIGEAFVRLLANDSMLNIDTIEKLLKVSINDLTDPVYGTKTKENFIAEKEKALNSADLATFLACFNIPSVGKTVSKLLATNFSLEDILNLNFTESQLSSIEGIGTVTVNDIIKGFKMNNEMMKNTAKLFSNLNTVKAESSDTKTICFTGKMIYPRSQMEEIAIKRGFTPVDHVTAGLTILVCADPNSGSSKLKKAAKYGTKIISEEDFINEKY